MVGDEDSCPKFFPKSFLDNIDFSKLSKTSKMEINSIYGKFNQK